MTFWIGQKVVCVDARLPRLARTLRWIFGMGWPLIEGEIYTVEHLAFVGNLPVVILAEVKNTPLLDGAFWRRRFRPVAERKTDISAFHEILRKTSRKDLVPA